MANVSFILKEPLTENSKQLTSETKDSKTNKGTLVYLIFRFNSQKLKYSTGQKIPAKFWNKEKQRAKESRQFPQHAEFNSYLNIIESKINTLYRKCLNDEKVPTPELLRELLHNSLNRSAKVNKHDLTAFIEHIINTTVKKPNTVKNYTQTLKQLQAFKKATKQGLNFEDIDLNFYNQFTDYCQKKNLSINSIGNYIKNVKVFMNDALDRKLHFNIEYKNKRFKTLEEDSESIYLNTNEIDLLYNLDLSNKPALDKVRDIFIISCYTGLRYSDLINLSNDNLIEQTTKLKIKTEKTGEMVIIPLHPYIKQIITKYKGIPTHPISNQKMNDYLKDLGKLAKINEQVTLSSTRGGIKQSESFEKYKLITMHTARRSFATNAFMKDIPAIAIMKLTGHRTEKAFLKYIKITQEDNANKLFNHPFFK